MSYGSEEEEHPDAKKRRNIRRKSKQKYRTLPYNGDDYEDYEDFEDEETFEKFSSRK